MSGTWVSVHRAIDVDGQVVDVVVSERRDTMAATTRLVYEIDEDECSAPGAIDHGGQIALAVRALLLPSVRTAYRTRYRFVQDFGSGRTRGATASRFVVYLNLLLAAPFDEEEATDLAEEGGSREAAQAREERARRCEALLPLLCPAELRAPPRASSGLFL